jgi:hypothetical protein
MHFGFIKLTSELYVGLLQRYDFCIFVAQCLPQDLVEPMNFVLVIYQFFFLSVFGLPYFAYFCSKI